MDSIILLLTLITLLTFSRSGFMVATPAVLRDIFSIKGILNY